MGGRDQFQFYSDSANAKPLEGAGERRVTNTDYSELQKIPNWRRVLSNLHTYEFTFEGKTWNSIEHVLQSEKIAIADPKAAERFTVGPDNDIGNGSGRFARQCRMLVKLNKDQLKEWDSRKKRVLLYATKAKYEQCELARKILLLTEDAELYHAIRRNIRERAVHLEKVREYLRRGVWEDE